MPKRNDPLVRFIALQELKRDPEYGAAATTFSFLMTLVLVTFELMFLLVRIVFAPASVYTVRLIARTKAEAAQVSADYARTVENIRHSRPRGNFRVVGGRDEANIDPPNPNGG